MRSVLKTVAATVKKSTWLVQICAGPPESEIAMLSPVRRTRKGALEPGSSTVICLVVGL